jgi:hypothetical protein
VHPDGYWLQTNPRTGVTVGDGVEYGSFATTHFCLAYLAELGLTREHPLIAKAADRYLGLQQPNGDFWRNMSCLNGYNIRTFIMLGYRDDPRLQKNIDLMLKTERADGGYLCDMHEKRRKTKKSCIRGCGKMLMAFAMMPEYWEHNRCKALLDYFLQRDCIFSRNDPSVFVNKDMERIIFPFVWRTSVLEVLWALSRMGLGKHPATQKAWAVLDKSRVADGRYIMDWSPTQSLLKPGKRGQPNKWITFYALQALKFRDNAPS